jgi:long-chain acyl-CoA synthetase
MIRGHNTMSGYLNNPEATAAAFTNGWLHTGDLAWMDEDGFLFFADRKKELIIRGGYNVYPREVEEVLYTAPQGLRGCRRRGARRAAGRGDQGLPHPQAG